MTPNIRAAVEADLPAIVEIERDSFSPCDWHLNDFRKHDCIVAEIENQIAGFLVSRDVFPGVQGQPSEREILNLAVAPVHRRLGVATALLRFELKRHATHFLEVRKSNIAAQKLYAKLGFIEVGRRPQYYHSPSEEAIVMRMK